MAKRSISTIILLTAAITIWCLVGYRIYRWFSPKDEPVISTTRPKSNSTSHEGDSLSLNYRDPFFVEEKKAEPIQPAPISEPAPESVMPTLSYKGLIRDGDGCVKAIVVFNGQVEGYKKGDKIGDVKVLLISPEVLTVRWRGRDYNIAAK